MKKTTGRSKSELSQAQVAAAAGVSLATVSLALNNHPRVAERTRKRVHDAATRLGYVPNQAARRMVLSRYGKPSRVLHQAGLVLFWQEERRGLILPYLAMLSGAEAELATTNGALLFLRGSRDSAAKRLQELSRNGAVDGWLVVGDVDDHAVGLVAQCGFPLVVLGDHRCRRPVHNVNADFHEAGRMAVQHLADLGHHRIGFAGSRLDYQYQRHLLDGVRAAVAEHHLDSDPQLMQTVTEPPEQAPDVVRTLVRLSPTPTAIIAAEPDNVPLVLGQLRQLEVGVPSEMNLVGVQLDFGLGRGPRLTTMAVPQMKVGQAGVALLRELVAKPETGPRRVLLAPELIPGWSTAPLAGTAVRSDRAVT